MPFSFAYSGLVLAKMFEGDFLFVLLTAVYFFYDHRGGIDFVLAYSGYVISKTIEGVSFRTGLRG